MSRSAAPVMLLAVLVLVGGVVVVGIELTGQDDPVAAPEETEPTAPDDPEAIEEDPEIDDPPADEPEADDPEAEDPEAEEPEADDPADMDEADSTEADADPDEPTPDRDPREAPTERPDDGPPTDEDGEVIALPETGGATVLLGLLGIGASQALATRTRIPTR